MTIRRVLLGPLILAVVIGGAASARTLFREYEVKAAFLYNLTQFVQWPETDSKSDFKLCLGGRDPFGPLIDYFAGEPVDDRQLEVVRIDAGGSLDACQMVFVSGMGARSEELLLRGLVGRPVLTVGESPAFTKKGGMVRFLVESERVKIEINTDAAEAAGFQFSGKLLKLVEVVRYPPPEMAR